MRRFRIGITITLIALLAGCGNDTSTSEEVGTSKSKMISSDMDSENTTEESDADDIVKEETETAEQEVDLEYAGDITEDAVKTDDSGDGNAVYLKPCATYQDILDNAYEVIISDRDADIVVADKLFCTVGIREARIGRNVDEALASIGYTFYDLDGNGVEELIIADMLNDDSGRWDNRILLMYTLHDDKPVLLIDGWARNRYYLLNDNTIYNEGSGGAAYTIFATYRMAEDKISLEIIDYYYSGYYSDSEWGWFYNTTGEMTEDESEMIEFEDESTPLNMMDDYCAQVKELELTFFASM